MPLYQATRPALLATQIRVFGYSRVTNGFDSRKHCDKRRYEYVLPEWAFDPRRGVGRSAALAASRSESAAAEAAAAGDEQQQTAAADADQQQQQQQQPTEAATAQPQEQADGAADGAAAAGRPARADGLPGAAADQRPAADGTAAAPEVGAAADEAAAAGGAAAIDDGPFVLDEARQNRLTAILSNVGVTSRRAVLCCAVPCCAVLGWDGMNRDLPALTAPACSRSRHGWQRRVAGRLPRSDRRLPAGARTSCCASPCSAPLVVVALQYQGTHNFHNYTVRKAPTALDVKRYILSFKCVPPLVLQLFEVLQLFGVLRPCADWAGYQPSAPPRPALPCPLLPPFSIHPPPARLRPAAQVQGCV